jgi:hypothetical protein
MDLIEMGWGGIDWIDLAQDSDQWRTLVNTVINLRVQNMLENISVAERLVAYQDGLSPMELGVSYSTNIGDKFSSTVLLKSMSSKGEIRCVTKEVRFTLYSKSFCRKPMAGICTRNYFMRSPIAKCD